MKGVVLAGGLGSRLRPLTSVTNKHLLPIYHRPMIYYPIQTLARHQDGGAKILLKQVPDPQRFGVSELGGPRVTRIDEKPKLPRSQYAVIGIYMYDARVFDIIRTLKPSGQASLSILSFNLLPNLQEFHLALRLSPRSHLLPRLYSAVRLR